jgi:drug/metabolite transporter (DMT)-like permease
MLYYSLIDQIGEEKAAIGNYLTPIFALVYGVVLLGESLTIASIAGLALIIVGAEITLRGDSNKRAGGKAKAHEYRPHPPFHA